MEVTIGSIKTYYEICGEGFPIIMLHGWGVDHRILKGCFEPIFQETKHQFKRIYVDLPGMGKTEVNNTIESTDDVRSFILNFIDCVIPGSNFALVGKSYGGYLSRGISKIKEEKVSGMFQICPVAFFETQLKNVPDRVVIEREEGIQEIVPQPDWEYFDLFHVLQTQEVWNKYKEHILPGSKLANQVFLANVLDKKKAFTQNIDSENCYLFPTTFICGRQDWCVGYSDLFTISQQFKSATYVVVDKAGHNVEYEQADLFKACVRKWLDDLGKFEEKRRISASTILP